jgi:type II secretion system protein N
MFARSPAPTDIRTSRPGVTRGQWLACAYIIFGLVIFGAVLVARFPYGDTLSSMLAPFQLRLTYQAQRMSLPFGAELDDVRLLSTISSSEQLVLQSSEVRLAPTIASLILGRPPGWRLHAALYGGTLDATLHRHADLIDLNFDLSRLDLGQSAPLRQFGALVNGTVSGAGSAQLRGPQIADNNATVMLDGAGIALEVTHGFPLVRLGVVSGGIILENGTVTLKDVEAHGGDVDVKADGTIQIAQDLPDSTVDMRVLLHPTPSGRSRFGLLLKLLPYGANDRPFTLSGRLTAPSIN